MVKSKRPTQDDVARLAGVTRATVSYVLTGRAAELKITPRVIQRVREAADKLRYVPNLAARSLVAGRSRQIGLLLPAAEFVRNNYWGPIVAGVERAALRAEYDVLVLASHDDPLQTAENYLRQNRVDLVITFFNNDVSLLSRLPVPPVVIGSPALRGSVPCVASSVGAAVNEIVEIIADAKLKRVLWIGPEARLHPSSGDRLDALKAGCARRALQLKTAEIDVDRQHYQNENEVSIAAIGGALENHHKAVQWADVAVCWNDLIAVSLYNYLRGTAKVPGRNFGVVGFDDVFAKVALPALASVTFDPEKLGEAAMNLALTILAEKDPARSQHLFTEVPARLILRESLLGIRRETLRRT